jgi:hypothetical protein
MLVMVGNSAQVSIYPNNLLIDDSADWNNVKECSLGTGELYEWVPGNFVARMGVTRNNKTVCALSAL